MKMENKQKAERAAAQKRYVRKWTAQGRCPFCSPHPPIHKGGRCEECYEKQLPRTRKSQKKRAGRIHAIESERKTVHEWLNKLEIPREEEGRPLCLLRRLRLLCDSYLYYQNRVRKRFTLNASRPLPEHIQRIREEPYSPPTQAPETL